MSDTSPVHGLPYIRPAQAQKHVTHNEALDILDAAVQLTVETRKKSSPPSNVRAGARYIVADGGSGDWAGKGGRIAVWSGSAWSFVKAQRGWVAHLLDEGGFVRFDDPGWFGISVPVNAEILQNISGIGINTESDAVNRVSVSADATLLSHDGDDHRVKINKARDSDTASLLFQSGWDGHAEMGLNGDTDFTLRVSADGGSFSDAMRVGAADGVVGFPNGLHLGAQRLEHYEQGVWTPRLTFSGSDSGIRYSKQEGIYVRVGAMVMLQCSVDLDSRGSATGTADICDLPFEPSPLYYPGQLLFIKGGADLLAPTCRTMNGPVIRLLNTDDSGTSNLTHDNITDSAKIRVTLMHQV